MTNKVHLVSNKNNNKTMCGLKIRGLDIVRWRPNLPVSSTLYGATCENCRNAFKALSNKPSIRKSLVNLIDNAIHEYTGENDLEYQYLHTKNYIKNLKMPETEKKLALKLLEKEVKEEHAWRE